MHTNVRKESASNSRRHSEFSFRTGNKNFFSVCTLLRTSLFSLVNSNEEYLLLHSMKFKSLLHIESQEQGSEAYP
jgi:hypothetical protein